MRHARLVFEISTQTQIAAAIINEKNDKIVDNVGFIGVADEFQDEDGAFTLCDECKPRSEGVDGHHGENSNDVELVLGVGVIAQVEGDVACGNNDGDRCEKGAEADDDGERAKHHGEEATPLEAVRERTGVSIAKQKETTS